MQCVLIGHNGIKLEMNNGKIRGKSQYMWKIFPESTLSKEISREIKNKLNENDNATYQIL